MTLGWKVPRFSGGAPVLGYFVDKREAQHRNWHEVNAAPVKERLLTVGVGLVAPRGTGGRPALRRGQSAVTNSIPHHSSGAGAVALGPGVGCVSQGVFFLSEEQGGEERQVSGGQTAR